jgi:hypothetical protein
MGGGFQLVKGGLRLHGRQISGGKVKGRKIGGLLRDLIIDGANDDLNTGHGFPPLRQMTADHMLPQHARGVPRLFRAKACFRLAAMDVTVSWGGAEGPGKAESKKLKAENRKLEF